ncbi:MAG: hypothetical protein HZA88_16540 [Verrucomicrobia bacterium]|nr:hypothetical protein [Verrucomicrobiota bacterium]
MSIWIKEVRERAGISCDELAILCGYSPNTIKTRECATSWVDVNDPFSRAITKAVDIDPKWLARHQAVDESRRVYNDLGGYSRVSKAARLGGNPFRLGFPCLTKQPTCPVTRRKQENAKFRDSVLGKLAHLLGYRLTKAMEGN